MFTNLRSQRQLRGQRRRGDGGRGEGSRLVGWLVGYRAYLCGFGCFAASKMKSGVFHVLVVWCLYTRTSNHCAPPPILPVCLCQS